MSKSNCLGAPSGLVLALVLVMSSYVTSGVRTTPSAMGGHRQVDQRPARNTGKDQISFVEEDGQEEELLKESYVTGSRLPDCTHACGPCFPCKRVMVSFKCVESAETCPIAYRCMCRGKFYHVPSL